MKALCPHCLGKGCDKCDGGYIAVRFKRGDLYTEHCTSCGFDNGGSIADPGCLPKSRKLEPCIKCGGKTEWKLEIQGFGEECDA